MGRTLIAVVLMGVACSSGPTFVPADLERVALQPSEAPAGTRYWKQTSGPQGFEIFAQDERAGRAAAASGWQAGYASIFVQKGYALEEQDQAPADALFVGSYVWLYRQAGQARIDIKEYLSGYAEEQGVERLSTEGLGEDAFGGRGAYPEAEGGQPCWCTPGGLET